MPPEEYMSLQGGQTHMQSELLQEKHHNNETKTFNNNNITTAKLSSDVMPFIVSPLTIVNI